MPRDRRRRDQYFDLDHDHADDDQPTDDVDADRDDDHSDGDRDDPDAHDSLDDDAHAEHDDACNHDARSGYNLYGKQRRSWPPGERDRRQRPMNRPEH
jgi:hypothetical protein